MNWTGGHLHRHSKANAKVLFKTQKQHFAKARQQSRSGRNAPSPFAFSILHPDSPQDSRNGADPFGPSFKSQSEVQKKRQRAYDVDEVVVGPACQSRCDDKRVLWKGLERKCRRSADGRAQGKNDRSCEGRVKSTPDQHAASEDETWNRAHSIHSRKSTEAEPQSLDAVKRNLLERSDWLGLSAARPLKMNFTSVEEMDRIGKRRKITDEDRRGRQFAERVSQGQPQWPSRLHQARKAREPSVLSSDDISIRIGSRIHHSQATQVQTCGTLLSSNYSDSASPESMLLDKEAPLYSYLHPKITKHVSVGRSVQLPPVSAKIFESLQEPPVLPLDQVRNSQSFDAVKARSSSSISIRRSLPETNPPRRVFRRAAHRRSVQCPHDSSSIITGRRVFQSPLSCSEVPALACPMSQSQNTFSAKQLARVDPTSLSSGFMPKEAVDLDEPTIPTVVGSGTQYTGRSSASAVGNVQSSRRDESKTNVVADHAPIPRAEAPREQRTVFTLERQVQLEADAQRQGQSPATPIPAIGLRVEPQHQKLESAPHLSPADSQTTLPQPRSHRADPSTQARNWGERSFLAMDTMPSLVPQPTLVQVATRPGTVKDPHTGPIATTEMRQQYPLLLSKDCDQLQIPDNLSESVQRPALEPLQSFQWAPKTRNTGATRKDENEAWMKFVFPEDLDIHNVKAGFQYGPDKAENRRFNHFRFRRNAEEVGESSVTEALRWQSSSVPQRGTSSPSRTIRTSANTIMNEVESSAFQAASDMQPSETDFLTQLSPMEGHLDERLADISVYNNAARTVRSFDSAPSHSYETSAVPRDLRAAHSFIPRPVHARRDQSLVFSLSGRPNSDLSSGSVRKQGGPFSRVRSADMPPLTSRSPPWTVTQQTLWSSNPNIGVQNRSSQPSRHGASPQISTMGCGSVGSLDRRSSIKSTPQRQPIAFPLDYSPMGGSRKRTSAVLGTMLHPSTPQMRRRWPSVDNHGHGVRYGQGNFEPAPPRRVSGFEMLPPGGDSPLLENELYSRTAAGMFKTPDSPVLQRGLEEIESIGAIYS